MKKFIKYLTLFIVGAVIYTSIEIMWRGFTHWSMAIAGGLSLIFLYTLNIKFSYLPLVLRCIFGSYIITLIEFVTGCLVNLTYNMNVWDYYDQPFNILGQICPLFTLFWFVLSFPAFFICIIVDKIFKKEQFKLK